MKNCRSLSEVYDCLATHRLVWVGETTEAQAPQADQKPDLPFAFVMCDEAADTTKNQGGKAIYDELCRIKTVEDVEIANWVRDFTDQLVQKLDRGAFDQKTGQWKDTLASSAQRWNALKKLIPQQSDLDNLIGLVQEATDFQIHYGRGILVVNFEMPKGPQQYHVIINENFASKFIGETEWFKAWLRDHQLERDKLNEAEVREAEARFLEQTNGITDYGGNLMDLVMNGPSMDPETIRSIDSTAIPWGQTDHQEKESADDSPFPAGGFFDDIKYKFKQ